MNALSSVLSRKFVQYLECAFVPVLSEAVLVIVLERPIAITSTRTSTTLLQRNAAEFVCELLTRDTR